MGGFIKYKPGMIAGWEFLLAKQNFRAFYRMLVIMVKRDENLT